MASQSGIEQQVTQIIIEQGRPQIRILVTCRQVVNANQDDRVQEYDLAQKDYFHFRTHGTEQMPRSAVVVALRVSTDLCYVLLLFFYDGGGGEGLCCRLVCHRSNEATTGAHRVFIVDEGFGIHPIVGFRGVAIPFYQSLRSSARCSTDSTRYTLSAGTDTFCRSDS